MKSKIQPPRLADSLFLWYCERASVEDLHGDVEELFYADLEKHSLFRAKLKYWQRIFSLIFSYALRQRKRRAAYHPYSSGINTAILSNYFKTAVRNLAKNKFYAGLNIFGLSLGMSLSLLFISILVFIYRYDNFHTKRDQIYRVITQVHDDVDNPIYASTPADLGYVLEQELPGIEKVVSIQGTLNGEADYEEKKMPVRGYFTEPEFFEVFDFPLLKGNPATALKEPNSILITEKEAEKIFGSKDPVGEVLTIPPYGEMTVTGVLKDVPKNSHLTFGALASYSTLLSAGQQNQQLSEASWTNFTDSYVYFLLPEGSSSDAVENFLSQLAKDRYPKDDFLASFSVQRLNDIVPGVEVYNAIGPSWDHLSILLVALTTLIILIPACANYVNLSISQSLKRMKEIGVRKVMGGQRRQIFFQFIVETTLSMMIALFLSYFFFELIRGEFHKMLAEADSMDMTPNFITLICSIGFALLVGVLAGIVPALYFSKINPLNALKSMVSIPTRKFRLPGRKIMLTVQYGMSLGFIMAVVIMLQQYRYSMNYDFGFRRENILDVALQDVKPQLFRNEFGKLAAVQSISMSSNILGLDYSAVKFIKDESQQDSTAVATISIDDNFIDNFGLHLIAGSNFSSDQNSNLRHIIINEEMVKAFNLGDAFSAVGKTLLLNDDKEVSILGVVKNFHYTSLRQPIGAFFFTSDPSEFQYANLSMPLTNRFDDLTQMEVAWKALDSNHKVKAQYFSDEIGDAYSFYFVVIKLWGFLGLLAVTVASIGLLGTVAFTIGNRLKEVSIRKVMGASTESVVFMLSKDFLLLIFIATIVTVPIVYFLFTKILVQMQYYSVSVGVSEIVVSVLLLAILGLTTIFSQTIRAANANPVDHMRGD
ncbi:ABC transporter permease [Algoriphagus terrigena]|uniref:ABC transporter permease n=1 Tax=Algoriphagus terrigena TaxID=344884 RepID=UPI0004799698|nr:ABC transporter permease [Algoriphagus terrigena]